MSNERERSVAAMRLLSACLAVYARSGYTRSARVRLCCRAALCPRYRLMPRCDSRTKCRLFFYIYAANAKSAVSKRMRRGRRTKDEDRGCAVMIAHQRTRRRDAVREAAAREVRSARHVGDAVYAMVRAAPSFAPRRCRLMLSAFTRAVERLMARVRVAARCYAAGYEAANARRCARCAVAARQWLLMFRAPRRCHATRPRLPPCSAFMLMLAHAFVCRFQISASVAAATRCACRLLPTP